MKKYRMESKPQKVNQGGLLQQLNWYQVNSDTMESKSFLYDYLVENGKSSVVDKLKKLDFPFHPSDGFVARLLSNGTKIPKNTLESFEKSISRYIMYSNKEVEKKVGTGIADKATVGQQRSFYEHILPKLGEVEMELDKFLMDGCRSDFSMLNWLHREKSNIKHAVIYSKCYAPLLEELNNALDGEKYYVESYAYMKRMELRRTIRFVSSLIEDCETYVQGRRKITVKKTPRKMVKNTFYKVSSENGKIVSIDPSKIIGADRLWVYIERSRDYMILYRSIDTKGLTVSEDGNIRNYNPEGSCMKVIPNPTKSDLSKMLYTFKGYDRSTEMSIFEGWKTKPREVYGKMTKKMILFKVSNAGDE